jgi:hypothetical protein
MIVRTCLLVSDDPDDHVEFSEALYEISSDVILVTVTHPGKAVDLLLLRQCVPSYIFLNLEMNGLNPDDFLMAVERNVDLQGIEIIAYGDYSDYEKLKTRRISAFLNHQMSYSELRNFLQKVVARREDGVG